MISSCAPDGGASLLCHQHSHLLGCIDRPALCSRTSNCVNKDKVLNVSESLSQSSQLSPCGLYLLIFSLMIHISANVELMLSAFSLACKLPAIACLQMTCNRLPANYLHSLVCKVPASIWICKYLQLTCSYRQFQVCELPGWCGRGLCGQQDSSAVGLQLPGGHCRQPKLSLDHLPLHIPTCCSLPIPSIAKTNIAGIAASSAHKALN